MGIEGVCSTGEGEDGVGFEKCKEERIQDRNRRSGVLGVGKKSWGCGL